MQRGRIHFTLANIMNKLISTKNRVFISLVGPSETGKSQLIYNWLRTGTFQPKFDKIYFFINIPNLFTISCKRKLKISSLRGVEFEYTDSLKDHSTKYLLTSDDSCAEICNSNPFLVLAIAGRQRGLSTIYNKHNFFTRAG